MAVRPIWRGHLRLALVSCPVALYNARHDRASIRFNLINPETGNRIRMITQDAETGDELERRSLVKGYEFRKNQYLLLSDEDLQSVKVESSSVMTVESTQSTTMPPIIWHRTATPAAMSMPSFVKRSPRPARWRCRALSSPNGNA